MFRAVAGPRTPLQGTLLLPQLLLTKSSGGKQPPHTFFAKLFYKEGDAVSGQWGRANQAVPHDIALETSLGSH